MDFLAHYIDSDSDMNGAGKLDLSFAILTVQNKDETAEAKKEIFTHYKVVCRISIQISVIASSEPFGETRMLMMLI